MEPGPLLFVEQKDFVWGLIASSELRVLLEEWFERIPEPFTVRPGADTTVAPGLLSIRNLPLVWPVAKVN